MPVVVVLFRAYDKDCKEAFINKSAEEIHYHLFDICPTYITCGILEYTDFEHKPVSMLEDFHRPEHREFKNNLKK